MTRWVVCYFKLLRNSRLIPISAAVIVLFLPIDAMSGLVASHVPDAAIAVRMNGEMVLAAEMVPAPVMTPMTMSSRETCPSKTGRNRRSQNQQNTSGIHFFLLRAVVGHP